jgi:arsenate reductase
MNVLFVCTGNSARSQMAEALARASAPAGVAVFSAGTHPEGIHALTREVMAERGHDLAGQRSKGLDEVPATADVVITLCGDAAETCPVYPGARLREHWELPDPARVQGDGAPQAFRRVRDDLERRIAGLWERLREG